MKIMADLLRRGQCADGVMKTLAEEEGRGVPVSGENRSQRPLPLRQRIEI